MVVSSRSALNRYSCSVFGLFTSTYLTDVEDAELLSTTLLPSTASPLVRVASNLEDMIPDLMYAAGDLQSVLDRADASTSSRLRIKRNMHYDVYQDK